MRDRIYPEWDNNRFELNIFDLYSNTLIEAAKEAACLQLSIVSWTSPVHCTFLDAMSSQWMQAPPAALSLDSLQKSIITQGSLKIETVFTQVTDKLRQALRDYLTHALPELDVYTYNYNVTIWTATGKIVVRKDVPSSKAKNDEIGL